ncbi:MAG: hypothetical protein ACI9P5_004473 [Saprospiraceae bacterium]|jgi:hypothetical protein|tara:strand:- start:440 stop:1009 length:570 start_codon:yes stop_codon:yes gene_type:complete
MESKSIIDWCYDLVFYVFDLLLLPEVYEFFITLTKSDYRFLSKEEKEIAYQYFGNSVKLDFVRVNTQMSKYIEKKAHAYVTLNTINYRRSISKPIFIHEMVHIWQYQRFGSMYIFRALKAQNSSEKYDYGGSENLYSCMIKHQKFTDFNFEQQGAIIEDYARLAEQEDSFRSPIVDASYEYYISQLQYL